MPTLDLGRVIGPQGLKGDTGATGSKGQKGDDGAAGKDATVNGVNALNLAASDGLSGSQSGDTYMISGSGLRPKRVAVTLTAAGWDAGTRTQKAAVPGVLADEARQLIQPVPALSSQSAYYEAGILCTAQAADSLTFTAETVPTADLTVYVVVQEVGA